MDHLLTMAPEVPGDHLSLTHHMLASGLWSCSLLLKIEQHRRYKAWPYGTPLVELAENMVEDTVVWSGILQHPILMANRNHVELLLASIPQEALPQLMEEPQCLRNDPLWLSFGPSKKLFS